MTFDLVASQDGNAVGIHENEIRQFITMKVADQLFGISVYTVRDVLVPKDIKNIPLSPREVAGSLNLRGRIVTAIDLRTRLSLPMQEDMAESMCVVVEHEEELYSLVVDSVGDVLSISVSEIAHNPENMPSAWQDVSLGIYSMKDELLVVLDVDKLLRFNAI